MTPARPKVPRELWERLEFAQENNLFEEGYQSPTEALRDIIRQKLREAGA